MKNTLLLLFFLFGVSVTYSQTLPPPPPANVVATQVGLSDQIKVSWSLVNNTINPHHGYRVYYNQQGSATKDSATVARGTDNYTITGLASDKTYNITVRSFRIDSLPAPIKTVYSAQSPQVNVIMSSLVVPSFAIESSGTAHNKIVVDIKDTNIFETGFQVELSENGFTKTVDIAKTGSSILETIGGLKPKTQYSVRVRAVKDGSFGPYSDAIFVTTLIDVPPAAEASLGGNCPLSVEIMWEIPTRFEEVERVVIMRSLDNETFEEVGQADPNMSPFTDGGALPGIRYYYAVHTQNVSGRTSSNLVTVDVPAYTPPNPPYNIISPKDSKTTSSLTFSWTKGPEDVVCNTNILGGTEVAIKVNGGEMQVLTSLPAWENMYKVENLKPKDEVEFLLRAHSDRGVIGGWVSVKDITFGPSNTPSNFTAVLVTDKIERRVLSLGWNDNSNDEDYFEIHKSKDGVNFYQYAILAMNYTKLIDTDIEEGKTYYYKLRSANWAGISEWTSVKGPFSIGFTKIPNAPYGLNLKRNGNGVDISWVDDSITEQNYIVEKSTDNGQTYIVIGTLDQDVTKYKDENISEDKTYFYRVKASNTRGSSAYSKERSITVGAAGVGLAVTVFPNPIAESLNLKLEGDFSEKNFDIKIYDQGNRLVLNRKVSLDNFNTASISASTLPQGIYNMTLGNGKELISKKLVKL